MSNVTELVFILDKSGSMSGLESDTIGGFNSMLKKQQADDDDKVFVSTVLFNNRSQVLHDRIPLNQVKPLTENDYVVGGTTALLDAVGDAIKHVRNIHKYARDEDRPSKTLFVITTDGYENASRKFSYGDIKQLIEQQKELGWEFVFLGANIDAPQVADSIGIDRRNAVNYHADDRGTEKVYSAMCMRVSSVRRKAKIKSSANIIADEPDDSWREELDEDFNARK